MSTILNSTILYFTKCYTILLYNAILYPFIFILHKYDIRAYDIIFYNILKNNELAQAGKDEKIQIMGVLDKLTTVPTTLGADFDLEMESGVLPSPLAIEDGLVRTASTPSMADTELSGTVPPLALEEGLSDASHQDFKLPDVF